MSYNDEEELKMDEVDEEEELDIDDEDILDDDEPIEDEFMGGIEDETEDDEDGAPEGFADIDGDEY